MMMKQVFRPEEFTGWHMFGVISLFFGVIISVNMFLAFNAATTWTGLTVKNTYVESQKFDARTAELEKQGELGWSTDVSYENGLLTLNLRDKSGGIIEGADVAAKVGRPVHEQRDHNVKLLMSDGVYAIENPLEAGEWVIHLKITDTEANVLERSFRFVVKG